MDAVAQHLTFGSLRYSPPRLTLSIMLCSMKLGGVDEEPGSQEGGEGGGSGDVGDDVSMEHCLLHLHRH